jgi:APA family basic amino acid/polyamine antiporter
VQNALTFFKVLLITAFVGAGFFLGQGSMDHFSGGFQIGSVLQGNFAVSLIFVSFAYSGWNAAAYLGGEIKEPSKNIPLSLFIGTLGVTCLYLLLNALYIYALSAEEMSGILEVGASSAGALFSSRLSRCFTGAIALGLLSVISAMIMAGPRVYYAMARDGVFFELFGKVNKLHRTPAHAIFLQSAIAILMVLTASFDKLLIYIGFTLSLCAALTVIGLVKLRRKQPGLKREYKTFGYPVTPFLFVLGNLWIISFSIRSKPIASLAGLGTIGLGLIVYCYFKRRAKRRTGLFA